VQCAAALRARVSSARGKKKREEFLTGLKSGLNGTGDVNCVTEMLITGGFTIAIITHITSVEDSTRRESFPVGRKK
jgi:hypothetical protein